jgi:ribosomal protein S18 acetylase RimI-like enzyme
MTSSSSALTFRFEVEPADAKIVSDLVAATGKFSVEETDIAVELVEERLNRGAASGYEFVFVHQVADHCPSNRGGLIQGAGHTVTGAAGTADRTGTSGGETEVIGFACYGKIPCTREAFDLYWIAVHPDHQGCGLGRQLLSAVEQAIRSAGGTQLYADTSGRADYETTRRYYLATGFSPAACLKDFYAPGDDKVIFRKAV